MRAARAAALALGAALAGCGAHAPPGSAAPDTARRADESQAVRTFLHEVARNVSRDGPGAWKRAFEDGPQFSMAANGLLVFGDGQAMARGVDELARTLPKIQLSFGEDLRVDPLTPTLAAVGASYSEVQTDAAGRQHDDHGYFTALAELKDGAWRLRSAHWSSVPPSAPQD
ncbi:MAG TPA: hypothetical protein VL994_02915 [Steroidobacteraceae bacterium]|nr:hypothetical protein [Steroidobacteraceae bacterium]